MWLIAPCSQVVRRNTVNAGDFDEALYESTGILALEYLSALDDRDPGVPTYRGGERTCYQERLRRRPCRERRDASIEVVDACTLY